MTVQAFSEDASQSGLAGSSRSAQQQSMAYLIGFEGLSQGLDDPFLPDDLIQRRRAILAV